MSIAPHYQDDRVALHHGDCLDVLRTLPDCSVDSIVTDPPYGLEFMGKEWDRPWAVTPTAGVGFEGRESNLTLPSHRDSRNANCRACGGRQRGAKRCECASPKWDRSPAQDMRDFQAWCELWTAECRRVLKPGGHLLAFGGTRTWHRLACAVEDAGFEVRDSIAWLYGSGFPKSLDVSKAIDKAAGAEREVVGVIPDRWTGKGTSLNFSTDRPQSEVVVTGSPATPDAERWQGWGTALKPAFEPVVVARKPLVGTVAGNVLAHGTGALNIDGCRIAGEPRTTHADGNHRTQPHTDIYGKGFGVHGAEPAPAGRWPANVVLDESQADALDQQSGIRRDGVATNRNRGDERPMEVAGAPRKVGSKADVGYGGSGGASRFFYVAKAPKRERPRTDDGTAHPTVKPLALMRWLVRLVTPPGGVVLEPFAGSGTTVEACILEGFHCVAIEREADYLPLIEARIARATEPAQPAPVTEPCLFELDGESA